MTKKNLIRTIPQIHCASGRIAEMLYGTQFAKNFTWAQINTIGEYIRAYGAKKGTVIFDEGEIECSMGIIVEGKIDIIKSANRKTRHVMTTLGPGKTFGEMSLIDGEPRSALAVASTDVVMLMITEDDFFALTDSKPRLGVQLLWIVSKMISQKLRKTSGQLVDYLNEDD